MDISKKIKLCKLDFNSTTPLYTQIVNHVTNMIHQGYLPTGAKLPPERELAALLGVSRTTAINVYRQLEKHGLVNTRVGSGTYVTSSQINPPVTVRIPWSQLFNPYIQTSMSSILKDLVSAPSSDECISLAAGKPDPAHYPLKVFQQLYATVDIHTVATDFGYIATEGYMPLRTAIKDMMLDQNIITEPENTMVISGSQQGLYLLSKILLEPGDYVIVESPTYIGALQIFQAAGARLLKVPVTSPLDLNLIEDYLIRYRPKLFYIIPTFQNPTGRCLSSQERQALLDLAARYRLIIVEDDPYGNLYYGQQPPPPLKTADQYGNVIYIGTFSKILFPGLRTGWLIAPTEVIQRLALEKQYIDLHSNNLAQILIYRYLHENYLQAHLTKIRRLYEQRRNTMAQALSHYCREFLKFNLPQGGFYFWCTLQSEHSSHMLLHEAVAKGITFVPGEAFYQTPAPTNQFRLCFATHEEERLVEGIKRLASVLKHTLNKKNNKTYHNGSSIPII